MIRKRLKQYLEDKGVSKYKFYKDNSISNGFLDKEGSIRSDICEKISYQYKDLNLIWLITGSGHMLLSTKPNTKNEDSTTNELVASQKTVIELQQNEIIRLNNEVLRLQKLEKESEILKNNKMFLPPKLDASIPKQAKLKKLEKDT